MLTVKMTVKHDDPVMDTFNIMANNPPEPSWEEDFDTNCSCLWDAPPGLTARSYAELVINYFNSTLKEGESPRALISARWT